MVVVGAMAKGPDTFADRYVQEKIGKSPLDPFVFYVNVQSDWHIFLCKAFLNMHYPQPLHAAKSAALWRICGTSCKALKWTKTHSFFIQLQQNKETPTKPNCTCTIFEKLVHFFSSEQVDWARKNGIRCRAPMLADKIWAAVPRDVIHIFGKSMFIDGSISILGDVYIYWIYNIL